MRARVVIVGAGSTGLSTAYWLQRMGMDDILIVERGYVGAGSSGRCAGGIRASFTSREHIKLMLRSIELWKLLARQVGGFEFRQSGYLWLLTSEEELSRFEKMVGLHNSLGLTTRIVGVDEIRSLVPPLKPGDVLGGVYDPQAGKVYPFDVLYSMYSYLRARGVRIMLYTEAEGLVVGGERAEGVRTSAGTIEVEDALVIAAGVWSRDLLRSIGSHLPIVAEPHHILVTEETAPVIDPLLIHAASGAYLVQDPVGGILMGAPADEVGEALTQRLGFIRKVVAVWSRYLPQLRSLNMLRYWNGYYAATPDHHPIVGRVEGYENLYVAAGFSGHGFMMAPIVGRELSELILEGECSLPETRRLCPERFARGELIREEAVIG